MVKRGDYIGVYTGGWFDKDAVTYKSTIDVFTNGWFEYVIDNIVDVVSQNIIFEPSISEFFIYYEIISKSNDIIIENSHIEFKVENIFNYYSALPNQWFSKCSSKYNNEREFMKVVQTEVYNTYGVTCYYYKMDYVINDSDKIWGENNNRKFSQYWSNVQVYYRIQRENKQWNKFGIIGLNDIVMYMSKEHFEFITDGSYVPNQGDLIQSQFDLKLYEVVEVKEESGMYFLDKRYTWELICREFKDRMVSVIGNVVGSPLSAYTDKPTDIFDIKNFVDIEKDKYIYKPRTNEHGVNDPFGNWK